MSNKVNNFTIFLNYFTPVGRFANQEIKNLRSVCSQPPVYQKRLCCDTIVLQHDECWKNVHKSTTVMLDSKGAKNITTREKIHFKDGFDLLTIIKKGFCGEKTKFEKQVLYNTENGKIEEKATKYISLDGPSNLTVKSSAARKSVFPSTRLGGSIHPAVAEKEILENGDVVYTEAYPYR